ncbi:MAG TPA: hypothetical protein VHZ73_00230 [Vicinamibacterales bacterium]|jgi:Spy/CpxP family protein refolding chaperone|nr:hypothetical protein [Vicinamibacterales bacterium]
MKVTVYRVLVCLAAVLAVGNPLFAQTPQARPPAPVQGAQAAPHGPASPSSPAATAPPPQGWWHSDAYRQDLHLTNDQILRMDHIFNDAWPRLTEENSQLDEREARLSRLIEMNAEEDQVAHQIDRVESARSLVNKDRQLMLVHLRQVLTHDQQVKFNERWLRRREQEQQPQRQGGPGSSSRPPQASGGPQRSTQPPASSATPTKRPE